VEHRDGRLELVHWQPDHKKAPAAQPHPSTDTLPPRQRPEAVIGPDAVPLPAFKEAAVGDALATLLAARVSDTRQR
jgi:hypothetical protein